MDAEFARILEGISLDDRTLDWIVLAQKESQADEPRSRDESIAHLQGE